MPEQCDNATKARRAHEAQAVADRMHRSFLEQSLGQTLPVLFETEEEGFCTGHSDTYVLVKARGTGLRGTVRNVRISAVEGDRLVGLAI